MILDCLGTMNWDALTCIYITSSDEIFRCFATDMSEGRISTVGLPSRRREDGVDPFRTSRLFLELFPDDS